MSRHTLMRTGLGGLAAIGLSLAAVDASAYVRSYTLEGCHPVFWAQTCVHITVDSDGVREMPLAEVESTVQTSINSWQSKFGGSSFMKLTYLPAKGQRETVATDKLQVIKFRSSSWGRPATDKVPAVTYDPSAAAITTVTYINKPTDAAADGRIIDADIELNAVNNYYYNADLPAPISGQRKPTDLWNTLTHEIGRLMGLEHTCKRAGDSMPSCTRDGNGNTVISCAIVEGQRTTFPAYQAIYDTTMYPTADPKETKKRLPKADDTSGIINTYPSAMDPRVCTVPESYSGTQAAAGCSMQGAGASARPAASSTLAWLGALATLGLMLARRRRRSHAG
jgi:hypothetical protein